MKHTKEVNEKTGKLGETYKLIKDIFYIFFSMNIQRSIVKLITVRSVVDPRNIDAIRMRMRIRIRLITLMRIQIFI